MLNRADNPYRDDDSRWPTDWVLEVRPATRVWVLFAVFLLPILAIAARLAYIQTHLSDRYAADFDRTTERLEIIPSRDGRILAADGEVLAEDTEVFGLTVHYRWLEEPADPLWLRSQAMSRLDRQARRDRERVAREEQRVLALRTKLWDRLARATGLGSGVFENRRHEIQRRIEQIYNLVEGRQKVNRAEPHTAKEAEPSASTFWQSVWQAVISALTTPPMREADEPLVIREQLDYHLLLPDIPIETAVEIEAHPEVYPGTRIAVTTRRTYPQGALAAHLVGYRTPIDDDSVQARHAQFPNGDPLDYRAGDRAGRTGLERQYERQLRGLRGVRKLVFNRRGEVLRTETVREPRYGQDIVLSLSIPLQRAAEELLDDVLQNQHQDETNDKPLPIPPGGAIVAIDARTGAVLAAASAPGFDLRLFANHDDVAWKRVLSDPRKPLFNRVTEMALPPGSVFKVLSAIAFLENGSLDPEREFHCQGYLDNPEQFRCLIYRIFGASHGDINLVDALARSCNVYFFAQARRTGAAPILDWGARLGFGQLTGIDLPGERGGSLPGERGDSLSREKAASVFRGTTRFQPGGRGPDALQLAIGQSKLTTTPLQVVRLMAAVANGGRLITPRLVDSLGSSPVASTGASDATADAYEPKPISDLSPRTLEWVRMGLAQVVADRQGTGYKTIRLDEVAIAGKTGTAEPGGGKPDHAWFAGYVPADRPKIAFVVVLENAGSGGHAAGPVARKFVQAMLEQGLLPGRRSPAASAN